MVIDPNSNTSPCLNEKGRKNRSSEVRTVPKCFKTTIDNKNTTINNKHHQLSSFIMSSSLLLLLFVFVCQSTIVIQPVAGHQSDHPSRLETVATLRMVLSQLANKLGSPESTRASLTPSYSASSPSLLPQHTTGGEGGWEGGLVMMDKRHSSPQQHLMEMETDDGNPIKFYGKRGKKSLDTMVSDSLAAGGRNEQDSFASPWKQFIGGRGKRRGPGPGSSSSAVHGHDQNRLLDDSLMSNYVFKRSRGKRVRSSLLMRMLAGGDSLATADPSSFEISRAQENDGEPAKRSLNWMMNGDGGGGPTVSSSGSRWNGVLQGGGVGGGLGSGGQPIQFFGGRGKRGGSGWTWSSPFWSRDTRKGGDLAGAVGNAAYAARGYGYGDGWKRNVPTFIGSRG